MQKHEERINKVEEPRLHPLTHQYPHRLVGLLIDEANVPKALTNIAPDTVWDTCTSYQTLVGYVYSLHRQLDGNYPQQGDQVVTYLGAGPFAHGNPKSQASLGSWWSTIERLNELRPDSRSLKIPRHTIALDRRRPSTDRRHRMRKCQDAGRHRPRAPQSRRGS